MRGQIKFLNRHGIKFDWDNDDLEEIEPSKTEEKLVQPDFIAEVPGIAVQGDYDKIIRTKPGAGSDKEIPSVAQRMAEASKNSGRNLEANTQVKDRGVDIGSSDGSVIALEVKMTSLMEECNMSSKSRSSLGKLPTTKREMTHRHWSMGVTATVLTMRMTTPHQQDKDTV